VLFPDIARKSDCCAIVPMLVAMAIIAAPDICQYLPIPLD